MLRSSAEMVSVHSCHFLEEAEVEEQHAVIVGDWGAGQREVFLGDEQREIFVGDATSEDFAENLVEHEATLGTGARTDGPDDAEDEDGVNLGRDGLVVD